MAATHRFLMSVAFWLVSPPPCTAQAASPSEVTIAHMEGLTRDFRTVQNPRSQTKSAALRAARSILRTLDDLDPPTNLGKAADRTEFQRIARAAAATTTMLVAQIDAGSAFHSQIALEKLRVSCIKCHVTLRPERTDGAARSDFPAIGNTVWGRVAVRDLAGQSRETLSGIVAFLDETPTPPARAPTTLPKLSQRDQQFAPRVLPVVVGTTVEFPNDDQIFHNVFSLSRTQPFDLGVYGKGKSKAVSFRKTGLVRIHCNIHPKMTANVLVLGNPYFDVTDERGLFVVTGIPDGKHVLRSWHEFGGGTHEQLEVRDGAVIARHLDIRETKKTVPHKNKFGKPYKGKY